MFLGEGASNDNGIVENGNFQPRRNAGTFRDIASILFLTSAVSWPAKAGSAYAILDMIIKTRK